MSENEKNKKDESLKRPVSQRKIEANRANSKHSTGPKTEAGKAKSAENSYKHGFFAVRLYPTKELREGDLDQYNAILGGLHSHYAPSGYLEHFWLEKMATELLRTARALGHGQKVLACSAPFETRSIDRLLRYESTLGRNLAIAKKMLEELQTERKEHESAESIEPDGGDAATTQEATPPSSTPEKTGAMESTAEVTS